MQPKPFSLCALFTPVLLLLFYSSYAKEDAAKASKQESLLFVENKGQIIDQYRNPRKDIDFSLSGGDIAVFIGKAQMHYQWVKTELDTSAYPAVKIFDPAGKCKTPAIPDFSFYRLDVVLEGADINAPLVIDEIIPYHENYYLPQCPGGISAQSCKRIIYKNVYPNIDWVIYVKDDPKNANQRSYLKYDFIIHKGGDASMIEMRYEGATSIKLENGGLMITTPFGTLSEQKAI